MQDKSCGLSLRVILHPPHVEISNSRFYKQTENASAVHVHCLKSQHQPQLSTNDIHMYLLLSIDQVKSSFTLKQKITLF
jgi:hypothetical protein